MKVPRVTIQKITLAVLLHKKVAKEGNRKRRIVNIKPTFWSFVLKFHSEYLLYFVNTKVFRNYILVTEAFLRNV